MSGIAGINRPNQLHTVERMLTVMSHRGPYGRVLVQTGSMTAGMFKTGPALVEDADCAIHTVCDRGGPERLAEARFEDQRLILVRDAFGVAPLYYGHDAAGALCFASEVKALLEVGANVCELQPGCTYDGHVLETEPAADLAVKTSSSPEAIAGELRRRLEEAVAERASLGEVGSWLSGGLDSSTMAALARPHVERLHTVAAGLPGAPDLTHARAVADFIDSDHHEVTINKDQMAALLPEVIYHLESFDALLVRSSITNYIAAEAAADYVPAVFSGEGGDELFAGYDYLADVDPGSLAAELEDITNRLHNTALQRVDRCAAAHGTVAYVPFLDAGVADLARTIPAGMKRRDGVAKWILRRAMADALPDAIVQRPKAKFWDGAGVGDLMAEYAETQVSDRDFRSERILPNDWVLNSKEELLYYRIFRERLGEQADLSWMGRTKGAPQTEPPV